MDQKNNPVVQVRLAANKDIDVVGTGATNYIVVTTPGASNSIGWNVTLAAIAPDQDIQFLVLDNRLLARQGSTTAGFTIQPST